MQTNIVQQGVPGGGHAHPAEHQRQHDVPAWQLAKNRRSAAVILPIRPFPVFDHPSMTSRSSSQRRGHGPILEAGGKCLRICVYDVHAADHAAESRRSRRPWGASLTMTKNGCRREFGIHGAGMLITPRSCLMGFFSVRGRNSPLMCDEDRPCRCRPGAPGS